MEEQTVTPTVTQMAAAVDMVVQQTVTAELADTVVAALAELEGTGCQT